MEDNDTCKDPLAIACAEPACECDVQRSMAYRCDECLEHFCYGHLLIDDRGQLCPTCYKDPDATR